MTKTVSLDEERLSPKERLLRDALQSGKGVKQKEDRPNRWKQLGRSMLFLAALTIVVYVVADHGLIVMEERIDQTIAAVDNTILVLDKRLNERDDRLEARMDQLEQILLAQQTTASLEQPKTVEPPIGHDDMFVFFRDENDKVVWRRVAKNNVVVGGSTRAYSTLSNAKTNAIRNGYNETHSRTTILLPDSPIPDHLKTETFHDARALVAARLDDNSSMDDAGIDDMDVTDRSIDGVGRESTTSRTPQKTTSSSRRPRSPTNVRLVVGEST